MWRFLSWGFILHFQFYCLKSKCSWVKCFALPSRVPHGFWSREEWLHFTQAITRISEIWTSPLCRQNRHPQYWYRRRMADSDRMWPAMLTRLFRSGNKCKLVKSLQPSAGFARHLSLFFAAFDLSVFPSVKVMLQWRSGSHEVGLLFFRLLFQTILTITPLKWKWLSGLETQ